MDVGHNIFKIGQRESLGNVHSAIPHSTIEKYTEVKYADNVSRSTRNKVDLDAMIDARVTFSQIGKRESLGNVHCTLLTMRNSSEMTPVEKVSTTTISSMGIHENSEKKDIAQQNYLVSAIHALTFISDSGDNFSVEKVVLANDNISKALIGTVVL